MKFVTSVCAAALICGGLSASAFAAEPGVVPGTLAKAISSPDPTSSSDPVIKCLVGGLPVEVGAERIGVWSRPLPQVVNLGEIKIDAQGDPAAIDLVVGSPLSNPCATLGIESVKAVVGAKTSDGGYVVDTVHVWRHASGSRVCAEQSVMLLAEGKSWKAGDAEKGALRATGTRLKGVALQAADGAYFMLGEPAQCMAALGGAAGGK